MTNKELDRKNKATVKKANTFYESWMDYKDRERRASSATSGTIESVKNGKYQLYDEYAVPLSQTPSRSPIPPQPVQPSKVVNIRRSSLPTAPIASPVGSLKIPLKTPPIPKRPHAIKKSQRPPTTKTLNSEQLNEMIKRDFGPFYSWVVNGRTDDMKREIIERLLFHINE